MPSTSNLVCFPAIQGTNFVVRDKISSGYFGKRLFLLPAAGFDIRG